MVAPENLQVFWSYCLFSILILLLLSVADFFVSWLSVASATWLAAAGMRSSGAGVTVRCCSCPFLVSSHNQTADLSVQLLLSAEPICGTSVASGLAVKLCVGASARL